MSDHIYTLPYDSYCGFCCELCYDAWRAKQNAGKGGVNANTKNPSSDQKNKKKK